jgi:hypothetical protein
MPDTPICGTLHVRDGMKRPTAFVIGLSLVGASSAFGQSQVSILSQQASATFGVTSAPIPAVVGAPYSGE